MARARAGVQEVEASGGAKAATSQVTFQTCPTQDPSGLREEIGPFWQGPGVENLSPMKQLPREPHGGQDQDLGDVRSPPGARGPQLPSVGWRIRSRRWARRSLMREGGRPARSQPCAASSTQHRTQHRSPERESYDGSERRNPN